MLADRELAPDIRALAELISSGGVGRAVADC